VGVFYQLYANDHDGNFTDGYHNEEGQFIDWSRGQWVVVLTSYMDDRTGILLCPAATKEPANPADSEYGGNENAYVHANKNRSLSSYGFNCWMYSKPPG
jgi:hypothetical protein